MSEHIFSYLQTFYPCAYSPVFAYGKFARCKTNKLAFSLFECVQCRFERVPLPGVRFEQCERLHTHAHTRSQPTIASIAKLFCCTHASASANKYGAVVGRSVASDMLGCDGIIYQRTALDVGVANNSMPHISRRQSLQSDKTHIPL